MADPCHHRRYSTLKGRSGSVFVGSLSPCAHMVLFEPPKHLWWVWGFDSKHNFPPLTILLGLLLCPWTWCIFFWWDSAFYCRWVFNGLLQFLSSHRRRSVYVLLLHHLLVNLEILKTQQWPQDWKRSVFIPIPKKGNAKECSNYHTIALISHASKVMLKILQARLQK